MDFSDLAQSVLFQGNTADEIKNILECIRAEEKNYRKDEVILRMGDAAESLGMVISGSVLIENDDAWGNRSILDRIGKGHIFAETYACVPGEKLMVNVVAAESATILFLNMGRMLQICSDANGSQSRLLRFRTADKFSRRYRRQCENAQYISFHENNDFNQCQK